MRVARGLAFGPAPTASPPAPPGSLRRAAADTCGVFVTRTGWDHIGGLPGLLLSHRGDSVSAASPAKLPVTGPPGLSRLVRGMGHFGVGGEAQESVVEIDRSGGLLLDDVALAIGAVLIEPEGEDQGAVAPPPPKRRCTRSSVFGAGGAPPIASFYGRVKGQAPNIDPERAKLLGVVGRDLGTLKQEGSFTCPDGTVVRLDQVLKTAKDPDALFALVDCPDHRYVAPLLNNPALAVALGDDAANVRLVFHTAPPDILAVSTAASPRAMPG